MPKSRAKLIGAAILAGACLGAGPADAAEEMDQTADSALWLLEKSTLVHGNDKHNVLLRALRQMGDPRLEPLFRDLVNKRHPALRIHGILGLGEISEDHRIDLGLAADLSNTRARVQLLSAAIDGDLLTVEQARRVMSWDDDGPEPAVRVIVGSYLARNDALQAELDLTQALRSDNPALKGTAALLRLHRGHDEAMRHLKDLSDEEDPVRDQARQLVLRRARESDFESVGPWARRIVKEEAIGDSLRFEALRTALRFEAEGAAELWQRRYDAETRQANRIRLAMVALDQAERLAPETFRPLTEAPVELIRQIGAVGRKLAAGRDATRAIHQLLKQNHTLASNWILQHVRDLPAERAEPTLIEIIRHAEREPNPERFRAQRLERTVVAAQLIAERSSRAKQILGRIFDEVPMLTQEAMLMGLIRSEAEAPHELIADRQRWPSRTARSLALLLRAKHGAQLSDAQLRKLALIIRGGAGLQDPLRVQAAWVYLKQTDQDKLALSSLTDG